MREPIFVPKFFARFECSKCVCDDSNITISLLKTYIFELKNKGF